MKKIGIFSVLILMTISLFGCPKVLVPHEDYPDWNEDKIDDRTQVLDATGETLLAYGYSTEKLFSILDYYKKHEGKGWMAKSIDVSKLDFNPTFSDDRTELKSYLFKGREDFNQDISNWDLVGTGYPNSYTPTMFFNTTVFNQNISIWDVSNVTDMTGMFYNAKSFDQNLSLWDIEGKDSYNMFYGTPMENKAEWHPQGCRCGSTGCQDYRGYTVDEEGNIIE